MSFTNLPAELPSFVRIASYGPAGGDQSAQRGVAHVLDTIHDRYGEACSRVDGGLKVALERGDLHVQGADEQGAQAFLFAFIGSQDQTSSLPALDAGAALGDEVEHLMQLFAGPPRSLFDLRIALADSREEAHTLLDGYLDRMESRLRSEGFVRGCVLAGVELGEADTGSQGLRREFVLLPVDLKREQAARQVWELCVEMAGLASRAGQLHQFRSRHTLLLNQIDASEQSTQMRINEILAGLRLPLEQIEPGSLEGTLTEVTTLFSRLSILAGSMRRDDVKAQVLLRGVRSLLTRWNEEPMGPEPTNSVVEADAYESLIAPLEDYIARVDAIRAQLNTVLEAVRTYLEIQGQRTSVEEQKSSKEQLIRLVNLQEILHKLEILIVAVYITEMARIVFEAVAHERALVLTAAFIPVALGLAVLVARLLHGWE